MEDKTFVELLEKHRHEFFCFLNRTVGNEADAEDVFCAAVLAAYEKREAFHPQTNLRAWMYKIHYISGGSYYFRYHHFPGKRMA